MANREPGFKRHAWAVEATARVGWLHRLIHHGQQLCRERVQIDLLAQPGAKCLDRLGGVVAAPVEATIHRGLDAAAGWLEQRRHGQGR
jgi:hypothetical protein